MATHVIFDRNIGGASKIKWRFKSNLSIFSSAVFSHVSVPLEQPFFHVYFIEKLNEISLKEKYFSQNASNI